MNLKKLIAAGMTGAMLLLHSLPVAAAGQNYEAVTGGDVRFDKYLVMDEEANVPNVTFDFTIAAASAGIEDTETGLVVQLGSADAVAGTPTIAAGQAVFQAGDETWSEPQDHAETGTQQATQPKDHVTLAEGQKYARKQVTVDFSGVSFSEPGVYRWVVTESASDKLGIDNDADAVRNLDVYVIDQDGVLIIEGYVFHNDDSFQPLKQGDAAEPAEGKSPGYTNTYTTYNIDLSKTVTGNQGSRDQYFKFTVTITGDTAGTVLDVDLSNADATTMINAYSPEAHTNPASLTLGADGSVTQDFWLQNGQNIVINGIPRGASYTVTEEPEDYRVSTVTREGDGQEQSGTAAEVSDDSISGDTTIRYTNDKTGIIPTNVIVKTAPFAAVMMIGLAGLFFLLFRKRTGRA